MIRTKPMALAAALLAITATTVVALAGDAPGPKAYTPNAAADRTEVPSMTKWDLSPLFPGNAEWMTAFAAL